MGDAVDEVRTQAVCSGFAGRIAEQKDHSCRENHETQRDCSAINHQILPGSIRDAEFALELRPDSVIDPILVYREA